MKKFRVTKPDIVSVILILGIIVWLAYGSIRMTPDHQKIDIIYKLKDVFDGSVSFKYSSSEEDMQYEVGDMFVESDWNSPFGDGSHATPHKYIVLSKKETK